MSSHVGASIPPWLQGHIMQFQKTQDELQSIRMQKQHLEGEKMETARTLEELKRTGDDEVVFKFAGTVMIRTTKPKMIEELEERQELGKTRMTVISKQESRLAESLKEQEAKITGLLQNSGGLQRPPSGGPPQPPPAPPPPPQQQP